MNKDRILRSLICVVVGAGLSITTGAQRAQAVGTVTAMSQLFLGEVNWLSDNDAERQNVDVNGNGYLDVGDTLRGITSIGTIEDVYNTGSQIVLGAGSINELTGIFEAVVQSRTIVADPDGSIAGGTGLTGDEIANFVFAPYAGFATEFGLPTGSMLAMFDDPAQDFTRGGTLAASEASATNGTMVLALGFGGELDELWTAFNSPVDTHVAETKTPATVLGAYYAQLSVLENNTSYIFAQVQAGSTDNTNPNYPPAGDGLIDVNGSGSLLGTLNVNTDWSAYSNVDFYIKPEGVVPEPGTMLLLGTGLLGLGAFGRRWQKKNQS